MKKSIEKIGIIAVMGIMLIGAYLLGTTQAKTITETKTVIKTETITKEVIPDGYIAIENCIPLEDIAGWYYDKYDYLTFSLKDTTKQLDNPQGKSYNDIIANLPHLEDMEQ